MGDYLLGDAGPQFKNTDEGPGCLESRSGPPRQGPHPPTSVHHPPETITTVSWLGGWVWVGGVWVGVEGGTEGPLGGEPRWVGVDPVGGVPTVTPDTRDPHQCS